MAQLRIEYVRALQKGPVTVFGDFNYNPQRQGAETDVDQEVRLFVEKTGLQDVSYNGARGPEGSAASRIDALYADPKWARGVTAGYMVGPKERQDMKRHCPMMLNMKVKVGEPGDNQDEEHKSNEEGFNLPSPVKWPEEEDYGKWRQQVQHIHVEMRRRSHDNRAMTKAATVCRFSRAVGEAQTHPKLQQLVAKLKKRQQEEVKLQAKTEGTDWEEGVAQRKKRLQAARRAVEDEHGRIYQKVVVPHERYMGRSVPYKSLPSIRELAGQDNCSRSRQ